MIAAIIPARSGGKRIRDKNIKCFDGKPIIAYSIEAAKATRMFDRIIVDTDSEVIAEISRDYDAEVPYIRPKELAGDDIVISDVLLHALSWLKENGGCDAFCCIYATAPFLSAKALAASYRLILDKRASAVISVVSNPFPIQKALKISTDGRLDMLWPENEIRRFQVLENAYYDAGQFFWANADSFIESRGIGHARPWPFVLDPRLVPDLNTSRDWDRAETTFRSFKGLELGVDTIVNDLPPISSRVALGTAQLGMDYGVHNWTGRPNASEAIAILREARMGGMNFIDTAQAYGSAEQLIGRYLAQHEAAKSLRIITKLAPSVDFTNRTAVEHAVGQSIERLSSDRIWSLLLHREKMLDELDGELGKTLNSLVELGTITNLGISVYTEEFALKAIAHPMIGIIEIPASVFDRRMLRAGVRELAAEHGKLLFIRSIFAQGLVFMNPRRVPAAIPFAREATSALRKHCQERGTEVRDFSYDYVRACFPDAFIIIGAETAAQAAQNCGLDRRKLLKEEVREMWDRVWPDDPIGLADPRTWRLPRAHYFKREFFRRLNGIVGGGFSG